MVCDVVTSQEGLGTAAADAIPELTMSILIRTHSRPPQAPVIHSRRSTRPSIDGLLHARLAYNGVRLIQEHTLPDWTCAPPTPLSKPSIECRSTKLTPEPRRRQPIENAGNLTLNTEPCVVVAVHDGASGPCLEHSQSRSFVRLLQS